MEARAKIQTGVDINFSAKQKLYKQSSLILSSRWFFVSVILLFAFEAIWLAITNRFPMAFDEGYHFGLIQFFSHRLDPVVTSQPASSYALGNIVHDPSFLYHYLLSFPYRVVAHFTPDLKIQVIVLRLFSTAMMLASLGLLRKNLRLLGLRVQLANLIVLLFAFTPIVSVLSAQINYDNLVILSAMAAGYWFLKFYRQLQAEQTFSAWNVLQLLTVCLFASLVKYEFLPIFVGLGVSLFWLTWRRHAWTESWGQAKSSLLAQSKRKLGLLLGAFLIGLSLFGIVYGTNALKYHNPVPQCNQVLSVAACQHYYAWNRNYLLATHKTAGQQISILHYSYFWLKVGTYQLFGEVRPTGGLVTIVPAFYVILALLTAFGVLALLPYMRAAFRDYPALKYLTLVAMVYLLVLWARNYHDYLQLGQPVGIQGRYFLPVLAYIYALLVVGVMYALHGQRRFQTVGRPVLATAVVLAFVYFGGYTRYVTQVSPQFGWNPPKPQVALITVQTNHSKLDKI